MLNSEMTSQDFGRDAGVDWRDQANDYFPLFIATHEVLRMKKSLIDLFGREFGLKS